jgi:hypothetical protein
MRRSFTITLSLGHASGQPTQLSEKNLQNSPPQNPMASAGRPPSLSVVAKSSGKLLSLLLSITDKHVYAA